MVKNYSDYRREIYELGQDNGMKPLGTKLYYATAQGVGVGVTYGAMNWAFYPDKFAYAHKGSVTSGPSRGWQFVNRTMLRPSIYFTAINITFSAVESFLEEMKGSHHKDPWNTAIAGFASGLVMGGFYSRRFDIAGMTGLGVAILMGSVEMNGPNMFVDQESQMAKLHPKSVPIKFEESDELSSLKEKYPGYKYK